MFSHAKEQNSHPSTEANWKHLKVISLHNGSEQTSQKVPTPNVPSGKSRGYLLNRVKEADQNTETPV